VHVRAAAAELAHEAVERCLLPALALQPLVADVADNGRLVLARDVPAEPLEVAFGAQDPGQVLQFGRCPRAHEIAQMILDQSGGALQARPAEFFHGAHGVPAAHDHLAARPDGLHRRAGGIALVHHDRLRLPGCGRGVLLQRLEGNLDVGGRLAPQDEAGHKVAMVERVNDQDGEVGQLQPVDAVGRIHVEHVAKHSQQPHGFQAVHADDEIVREGRGIARVPFLIAEQHARKPLCQRVAE
jgi:hypothetical protein